MVRPVLDILPDKLQLSLNDLTKWTTDCAQTTWQIASLINVAPQKPRFLAKWPCNLAERYRVFTKEVCHCLHNSWMTFLVMLSNMSVGDLVVSVNNDSLVASRHFIQWSQFSFHLCMTREIGHVVSSTFFPSTVAAPATIFLHKQKQFYQII